MCVCVFFLSCSLNYSKCGFNVLLCDLYLLLLNMSKSGLMDVLKTIDMYKSMTKPLIGDGGSMQLWFAQLGEQGASRTVSRTIFLCNQQNITIQQTKNLGFCGPLPLAAI